MLFVASYAFLLRLPSEGLPLAVGACPEGKECPVFSAAGGEVEVWFPFRKHRQHPTKLVRACWCEACPITCPVHVLGAYMAEQPVGSQPFVHICQHQALLALREMLTFLGVANAWKHRTHDFRRGHAEVRNRAFALLLLLHGPLQPGSSSVWLHISRDLAGWAVVELSLYELY